MSAWNPLAKVGSAIWEHEEVVKMRLQFAELDAKVQSGVILGGVAGSILLLLLILFLVASSAISVKQQVADVDESIRYLNQSSEKMDELRQKIRSQSSSFDELELTPSMPLPQVVEKVAAKSSISKEAIESPADAGPSIDVKLNKISLKQLVRFLFYVEASKAQAQFQALLVETRADPEGYLWATIKLSRQAAPPAPGKGSK